MPSSATELQYIAETARATWWLVYATWALAAVTLAIAGATVWVMLRQLRESKATTQLNLHRQLVSDFESEAMGAIRSRVAAILLNGGEPEPNDIEHILDRLESIAYHARRNMLDLELVWNDFAYAVRCYWHKLSEYVVNQRKLRNDKTLFEETEWLYGVLHTEEIKRRGLQESVARPSDDEIRAFLRSESEFRDRARW